jgi:hypothetical protein
MLTDGDMTKMVEADVISAELLDKHWGYVRSAGVVWVGGWSCWVL